MTHELYTGNIFERYENKKRTIVAVQTRVLLLLLLYVVRTTKRITNYYGLGNPDVKVCQLGQLSWVG